MIAHNRNIINKNKSDDNDNCADGTQDECNCRKTCPLPGKCRLKNVVYKAEIENVTYIEMTSTEFRGRVRRHKHSFITESKSNETTLSKYIWDNELNRAENDSIIEPVVHWSILKNVECIHLVTSIVICVLLKNYLLSRTL